VVAAEALAVPFVAQIVEVVEAAYNMDPAAAAAAAAAA
jgi:hypothetical protein